MDENVLYAFALTAFAGLATGVGSALAFFSKRTNVGFLSASLGFSAGVMLYVSFVEIIVKARESLTEQYGEGPGAWYTVIAFFGGILLIMAIDLLIPSVENPHEMHTMEELEATQKHNPRLMRMGLFTALAIGIHNFPEGLATFVGALEDPSLGLPIAIAIAIHNIPEGVSVSIPIYYATGSRKKAFWYSFLSGASEPVGALLGYFLLMSFFTTSIFGILFAGVAGIMVYVSLDELLPAAREYGTGHIAITGAIIGMAVMALSLLLFI